MTDIPDNSTPLMRRLFDGKTYPLVGEMIIGRHNDCGIVLEHEPGASRKHARITVAAGEIFISDLGSLNGTLVNSKEIEGRHRLGNGDLLVFDEQEYEILIPGPAAIPFDEERTVVANKAEIGQRHLIKPAIRVVDTHSDDMDWATSGAHQGDNIAEQSPPQEPAPPPPQEPAPPPPPAAQDLEFQATQLVDAPVFDKKPDNPAVPDAPAAPAAESYTANQAPAEYDPEFQATQLVDAPVFAQQGKSSEPPLPEGLGTPEIPDVVRNIPDQPAVADEYQNTDVLGSPFAQDSSDAEKTAPMDQVPPAVLAPALAPAPPMAPEPPEPAAAPPHAPAPSEPHAPPPTAARPAQRQHSADSHTTQSRQQERAQAPQRPPASPPPPDREEHHDHRPGAWANTSAILNSPNRTVIASPMTSHGENPNEQAISFANVTQPSLLVQTGEHAGRAFTLVGERSEWTLGSDQNRELPLISLGVSANHAAIFREGSKWKVCDQMSVNGTYVNGNKTNVTYINNGDVIRFGPIECVFALPAGYKRKGGKNTNKGIPVWMIAGIVAILVLLVAGGWFAFSSGLFS